MKKRLRKKLRLGEFRELGFELTLTLRRELHPAEADAFSDAFLEFLERKGLCYTGGIGASWSGVVARFGRGSVSEGLRTEVEHWLGAQPRVNTCNAGPLFDLWH